MRPSEPPSGAGGAASRPVLTIGQGAEIRGEVAVRMLRFGRWSISLDQWLETLAASFAQTDGLSRVPILKLPISNDSLLTADSVQPQPIHDDSTAVTPLGTSASPLAAESPVIWLLPENETLAPRAEDDSPQSTATASFLTPAGGHIDFI